MNRKQFQFLELKKLRLQDRKFKSKKSQSVKPKYKKHFGSHWAIRSQVTKMMASRRFAAYLAKLRPDIKVIGLDLSAEMVKQGNNSLRAENLADRVTLIECDMIKFSQHAPPETSLVTSIFSLHHLPGLNLVSELFNQVNIFTEKTGGSFFLFDLVRPRHIQTTLLYPEVFTANSAGVFKEDTTNSLKAAFTHEEIKESFEDGSTYYSTQDLELFLEANGL